VIAAQQTVCLAVSAPDGANIVAATTFTHTGLWRILAVTPASDGSVIIRPKALTGISGLEGYDCRYTRTHNNPRLLVFAARYDPGWRLVIGHDWQRPELADGWAMAWPLPVDHGRLVYLPSIAQAIFFTIGILTLAGVLYRLGWNAGGLVRSRNS
jgi:hypothetical protein